MKISIIELKIEEVIDLPGEPIDSISGTLSMIILLGAPTTIFVWYGSDDNLDATHSDKTS